MLTLGTSKSGNIIGFTKKYINRHGFITGSTGTGKSVTLMKLCEVLSKAGTNVFISDVKGDISGLAVPKINGNVKNNVRFWDLFNKTGLPLQTSIQSLGSTILSNILDLNETQASVLTILFSYIKDSKQTLVTLDDVKKHLQYMLQNMNHFKTNYGLVSEVSIGKILTRILEFKNEAGDCFFNNPEIELSHLMSSTNRGIINVLDSTNLINNKKFYSSVLFWLLSKMYNELPEVGDLDVPKFVFIFDEAHLLFNGNKLLQNKLEQMVRLIRSKGVGIYFCSQLASDIPDNILSMLSNKIQHGLRVNSDKDIKALKTVSGCFIGGNIDIVNELKSLQVGEALFSTLNNNSQPSSVEVVKISLPQCQLTPVQQSLRNQLIQCDPLYNVLVGNKIADEIEDFINQCSRNTYTSNTTSNSAKTQNIHTLSDLIDY